MVILIAYFIPVKDTGNIILSLGFIRMPFKNNCRNGLFTIDLMFTVNKQDYMPKEFHRFSTKVRSHLGIITFININVNVLLLDSYSKHEK